MKSFFTYLKTKLKINHRIAYFIHRIKKNIYYSILLISELELRFIIFIIINFLISNKYNLQHRHSQASKTRTKSRITLTKVIISCYVLHFVVS